MIVTVMGILLVCVASYARTKVKLRAQRYYGVNTVRSVSFTLTNTGSVPDSLPNSGK
jgi:hypothetical protein